MFVDGQEWKLVPVEPTPDWIANLSDKGLRIGKLESAIEDMLDAAPTPPAQDQGDDCDDVDAILRIVGLDPERCRTEGGALNVGRVRTLWEDVVSLAAQASGQAAPSDDEIETLARDYCDDPTVGAIVFTSTRDCVGFARALLSRYGQAPAASADLGGLTDAEIDAIWTRPVSATASATVIRRETAELLIRAAALKAAPVAAQAPQEPEEPLPPPGIHAAVHYAGWLRREAHRHQEPKAGVLRQAARMLDVLKAECGRLHQELIDAQAPAVPPEKPLPDLMMASYHEAVGWNACRAAMLANSPAVAPAVPEESTTAARDEFPMLYDSLDALDERAAEQPERIGTQRHLSSLRTSIQAVVQKLSLARARISDLESAASAEPVLYQFLGGNGTWGNVINDQHLFDLIATGYTIRALYAAPVAPQAQSWAPAGPLRIECDPERFGKASWHVTDGHHHAVGATPNEALNGFARYLAAQSPAANGDALREAVKTAYGYLWHVNNEPGTPNQYAPERAAYEARKTLRGHLTKDERGEGINAARALMQRTSGGDHD